MTSGKPILYDYWRSSASYRVRIALNLLRIEAELIPINLLKQDQKSPDYLAKNPQGLVPALEIDGLFLTQSLAIIEYLNDTRPDAAFLPDDAAGRARVRALSLAIAAEIHPVCNTGVVNHVLELTGAGEAGRVDWMKHFIRKGLAAFEAMLDQGPTGKFCHGDRPGMADFCLVPQVYNAHRWGVDIADLSRINAIVDHCNALPAFEKAAPVEPAA